MRTLAEWKERLEFIAEWWDPEVARWSGKFEFVEDTPGCLAEIAADDTGVVWQNVPIPFWALVAWDHREVRSVRKYLAEMA